MLFWWHRLFMLNPGDNRTGASTLLQAPENAGPEKRSRDQIREAATSLFRCPKYKSCVQQPLFNFKQTQKRSPTEHGIFKAVQNTVSSSRYICCILHFVTSMLDREKTSCDFLTAELGMRQQQPSLSQSTENHGQQTCIHSYTASFVSLFMPASCDGFNARIESVAMSSSSKLVVRMSNFFCSSSGMGVVVQIWSARLSSHAS